MSSKARRIEQLFEPLRIVAALAIALVVTLLVLILVSDDPIGVVTTFITGPFSSARRIGSIINLAIPFTFTGLGMCFVYAVNKLNLAGEGIFMTAGIFTTGLALAMQQLNLPNVAMWLILTLAGGLIGMAFMMIPALLDFKFGANVVVVSLMLNSIMSQLSQYMLKYHYRDPSLPTEQSYAFPANTVYPTIFGSFKIESAIFVVLIFYLISCFIYQRTTLGYAMRMVGSNAKFARITGMGVAGTIIVAQLLGGFLAGVGGTTELFAHYVRYTWTDVTGHGFDGLLVAVLAKKNPKYVPLTALFLAYIRIGSNVVNSSTSIPSEFIQVIQFIIILLVAAEMFLNGTKRKMIEKAARDSLAQEDKSKLLGSSES